MYLHTPLICLIHEISICSLHVALLLYKREGNIEDFLNMPINIHLRQMTDNNKLIELILKAPISTAEDNISKYFYYFSEKIKVDISCQSSAHKIYFYFL